VTAGRRAALGAAVLAAPLAWAAQLVIGYSLEAGGCSPGDTRIAGSGVGGVAFAVSVVTALVAAAGGVTALLLLRRRDAAGDPRGSVHFVAGGAAMAAAIFLVLIVFGAVATIVLDPCTAG
jgi:hypothetical protein